MAPGEAGTCYAELDHETHDDSPSSCPAHLARRNYFPFSSLIKALLWLTGRLQIPFKFYGTPPIPGKSRSRPHIPGRATRHDGSHIPQGPLRFRHPVRERTGSDFAPGRDGAFRLRTRPYPRRAPRLRGTRPPAPALDPGCPEGGDRPVAVAPPRAPPAVLRALLFSEPEIAAIVLVGAPDLPEADLLALVASGSPAHLHVLAARRRLSPPVVDALAERLGAEGGCCSPATKACA
ncbi:DUF2336 domain-containing protein [Methylobrevis pamukkalensis]|uniref:DUF2336 domain-containing protein n=1 Tax=Methylobrevis pamukkalensis TaxID=1439726 RepID=UPI003CC93618